MVIVMNEVAGDSSLYLQLFMTLLGLIAHFLKELVREKAETGIVTRFTSYWVKYPFQSGLSVIGAIAGFIVLREADQLSTIGAFGLGYAADSMADIMGKRGKTRIGEQLNDSHDERN